jgi:hypothetical protein
MGARLPQYSCWPSDQHRLLLSAGLGDRGEAFDAWTRWQRQHDLDAIDAGALRLLPLVYRNLTAHGAAAGASLGRLRGVYRQTWYRNQLVIGRLADLLRQLQEAGIDTLMLKGVPLALAYYGDVAARPMADADVLVRASQGGRAFEMATAAGWRAEGEPGPSRFTAARALRDGLGIELDLHTHVLHECLGGGDDDVFWDRARPIDVGGVAVRTLAPADQLLHVIVHGCRRATVPPVRWVADAIVVMRASGDELDWSRLVVEARARRLTRILARALRFLRKTFHAPVPEDAIAALAGSPVSITERLECWSRVQPGRPQLLAEAWCEYARARGREPGWRGPLGFVTYLKDRLGVKSVQALSTAAASKIALRHFPAAGAGPRLD